MSEPTEKNDHAPAPDEQKPADNDAVQNIEPSPEAPVPSPAQVADDPSVRTPRPPMSLFGLILRLIALMVVGFLGGALLSEPTIDLITIKKKKKLKPQPPETGPIVVTVGKSRAHNMGLMTTTIKRGAFVKEMRTLAHIDYDETRTVLITSKIGGWVERLAVDHEGMRVKRGKTLLTLFSPQLILAQEEYLIAWRSLARVKKSLGPKSDLVSQLEGLLGNARRRLRYFDVSAGQIRALERKLRTRRTMGIFSPVRGVVVNKRVHRGMFIKAGQTLMRVSDLSRVWAYIEIFQTELPWVRLNQAVELSFPYLPGHVFRGKVSYIEPYIRRKTRLVRLRVALDNQKGLLRPNMFGKAILSTTIRRNTMLITDLAVVRDGEDTLVFVDRGKGEFEARPVVLNHNLSKGGYYEVLRGLHVGEKVVISGLFLLDSARLLKRSQRGDVKQTTRLPKPEFYTCPMPEHKHVKSDKPGRCPDCQMKLVPVFKQKTIYTCPMKVHWHIRRHAPGRCPLCGMTLVPTTALKDYKKPSKESTATKPAPRVEQHDHSKHTAVFSCPMKSDWHVRSMKPGKCHLCGMKLKKTSGIEGYKAPKPGKKTTVYSCPMKSDWHIVSHKPGKCHLCGMKLLPIKKIKGYESPYSKKPHKPHTAVFSCPMKSDWHVRSMKPGKCHLCGMKLKKTSGIEGYKAPRPGKKTTVYSCPMKSDWHVVSHKPGKCHLCGMKLLPVKKIKGYTSPYRSTPGRSK